MNEYIEIDKNEIPYAFEVELAGEIFEIEVNYNETFDFFTIDLFKEGDPLVTGEKLILNRPLFRNRVHIDLPKAAIIPMDRSQQETRITYENLNETVFLFIIESSDAA